MDPLESYLTRLREIRSSGQAQPETSYYDALANLLNEIGKSLLPEIRRANIYQFADDMNEGKAGLGPFQAVGQETGHDEILTKEQTRALN
jgi:hypothetical protein